ncbi:MAG: UDP-N-acetylglucosamine 2-epimerase (non-hydrolyzing), partial [Bacteroidota bacterium]
QVTHIIVHTGQHFYENMSKVFFIDLGLPEPQHYLDVKGGSHAQQTALIISRIEVVFFDEKPDLVIVVGDVNSTVAASIVASKLGIKVAHVEAGLRSFDNTMPEEINRTLTDVISNYLFVSEPSGLINLKNEGIKENKIFFVGNVMIDTLFHYLLQAESSIIFQNLNINKNDYILITFHRPSNVDTKESLINLVSLLNNLARIKTIVFPIHPRTLNGLKNYHLIDSLSANIILSEPIGYIDFLALQKYACLVITDSGGIQEETTVLGVQCITVRKNTERPITVEKGTNHLVGPDLEKVYHYAAEILSGNVKHGKMPELWDGKTSERIVNIVLEKLCQK